MSEQTAAPAEDDADETSTIMLVQQYAAKFGITFSSSLMNEKAHKEKLMLLMWQAISGKRGAVTDADVVGEDTVD
jgi:hypothetical protein